MDIEIVVDRWFYDMPCLTPNKNGDIVLVCQKSFGPLEVFEWGIDSDGVPYESYKWLENDFYADENGRKAIDSKDIIKVLDNMIDLAKCKNLTGWIDIYEKAKKMIIK